VTAQVARTAITMPTISIRTRARGLCSGAVVIVVFLTPALQVSGHALPVEES
jgi:hypothetical protein